jgi:hypothetical protein
VTVVTRKRPEPCTNVEKVSSVSFSRQIGLRWMPGEPGSSPILDYTLLIDTGLNGKHVKLVSGILTTNYTVSGLTPGS